MCVCFKCQLTILAIAEIFCLERHVNDDDDDIVVVDDDVCDALVFIVNFVVVFMFVMFVIVVYQCLLLTECSPSGSGHI